MRQLPEFGSLEGVDFPISEHDAMDGTTATPPVFQTPPRILIPKLVISRDGWKAKANQRKKKLKAACIRIRDLVRSRDNWKDKSNIAETRIADLERRIEQANQDLAATRDENARLRDESKKKETSPH